MVVRFVPGTWKLNAALVEPSGITTDAGVPAIAVFVLRNVSVTPPAAAALLRVAVPVTVAPGFTLMESKVTMVNCEAGAWPGAKTTAIASPCVYMPT